MKTSSHAEHLHDHSYLSKDARIARNEKRTAWVVVLTAVAMVIEIVFGYLTGSVGLLADGWHMASHVCALGVSLAAYRLGRSPQFAERFTFGTGKIIPLGGFTSALALAFVAFFMFVESTFRFLNPVTVDFATALWVASFGLLINLLSAWLLFDPHHYHHHHHEHEHDHQHEIHDHNHEGAFLHVVTDALTSVLAIIGLFLGRELGWIWADPAMGVVGALVILKWSYGLMKVSALELLDAKPSSVREEEVIKIFKELSDTEVTDVHVWRLAPNVLACEIMVCTPTLRGSDFYREKISQRFQIAHLIVEERICQNP